MHREARRERTGSMETSAPISTWAKEQFYSSLWWLVDYLGVLLPALKVWVALLILTSISVFLYYRLRNSVLPESLLREPIYFDFSLNRPTAKFSLLADEKQWSYLKDCTRLKRDDDYFEDVQKGGDWEFNSKDSDSQNPADRKHCSRRSRQRLLMAGHKHSVDVTFTLSKSKTNMQMGKFMLRTVIYDTRGEAVAQSSRPIVVPYQSDVSLFLESAAKFPFRFVGLIDIPEVVHVRVPVMNDYLEPQQTAAPSEVVELTLSSASADVHQCSFSIMPELVGIAYFMYHYPIMTFAVGVVLILGMQIALITALVSARWLWKFLSNVEMVGDGEAGGRDSSSSGGEALPRNRDIGANRSDNQSGRTSASAVSSSLSLLSSQRSGGSSEEVDAAVRDYNADSHADNDAAAAAGSPSSDQKRRSDHMHGRGHGYLRDAADRDQHQQHTLAAGGGGGAAGAGSSRAPGRRTTTTRGGGAEATPSSSSINIIRDDGPRGSAAVSVISQQDTNSSSNGSGNSADNVLVWASERSSNDGTVTPTQTESSTPPNMASSSSIGGIQQRSPYRIR